MSRIRTGWGSGDWLDQGAAHAVIAGYSGSAIVSSEPDKMTPGEQSIHSAIQRRSFAEEERRKPGPPKTKFCIEDCNRVKNHRGKCTPKPALCGQFMLIARETCARRDGHAGTHATRSSMQHKSRFMSGYKRRRAA